MVQTHLKGKIKDARVEVANLRVSIAWTTLGVATGLGGFGAPLRVPFVREPNPALLGVGDEQCHLTTDHGIGRRGRGGRGALGDSGLRLRHQPTNVFEVPINGIGSQVDAHRPGQASQEQRHMFTAYVPTKERLLSGSLFRYAIAQVSYTKSNLPMYQSSLPRVHFNEKEAPRGEPPSFCSE